MSTTEQATTEAEVTLTEWVDGLTAARDHLRSHPALAERATVYPNQILICCFSSDEFATLARELMSGAPVGSVRKTNDDTYSRVSRYFGPVEVYVFTDRSTVCERRQVGVETVEVPDPEAPTVTVERPVYAWDCTSILDEVTA